MKLLFLQENSFFESLGIMALAGQVQAHGHTCDLLIGTEEDDLVAKIAEIKPDLIGFSLVTRSHEWPLQTIRTLKRLFDIPIIIGGPHATMYPDTLAHSEADYLATGDGELTLTELLDTMEQGGDTRFISNLHVKADGEIIKNKMSNLISEWDSLPLPDFAIYGRYPFLMKSPLKRFITSFGCPFSCSFCHANNFRRIQKGYGKAFRRKSIDRVIAEIKDVVDNSATTQIHFVDDTFNLEFKWMLPFLAAYKREIGLPWTANVLVDTLSGSRSDLLLNEEMIKAFKDSGCKGVSFGVEAGNYKTRKEVLNKDITDEAYFETTKLLRQYGITYCTSNIIGLPNEGVEEAFETMAFNRKIGTYNARASGFWPFPDTPLTEMSIEWGLLDEAHSIETYNNGDYPMVDHPEQKELIALVDLFPLVAKHRIFERIARFLIKRPESWFTHWFSVTVDKVFWIFEARFFGLLNVRGLNLYLHHRKALWRYRRHSNKAISLALPVYSREKPKFDDQCATT